MLLLMLRASHLTGSNPQQACMPLLSGASLSAAAAACGVLRQLVAPAAAAAAGVRAASSKGRGGRKYPSHMKGYDRLISQWQRMTARPGSSTSKGVKKSHAYSSYASDQPYRSKPHKHKPSSSSSTWYDADLAAAAAAARLHPDELHNLVFGRSDGSSSSSKGSSRRQARKQARKRAKLLRKQAQAAGASTYGFAWAQAGGAHDGWYAAYDSDDDDSYSGYSGDEDQEDEYLAGAYSYFSPSQGRRQQQRQWEWQRAQPDWQWWTEEQEKEWFVQAWQRADSSSGQRQQHQQHRGHHQAWWERFQQQQQASHQQRQQQQQRQQHQQQQRWQHWGYSSSSSSAGSGSHWQQSTPSHTPAIVQHLSALGLPPSTQLQKQQLKVAFHKAAMQWHPDKHPDASAKAAAEVRFKEAKAAYEVLVQHVTA